MKSIIFFCFSLLSLSSGWKLRAQHRLRSSDKNVMLASGDRIDGRYRLVEKTNELTCPKMNEEWIAADELLQNNLVILKFYYKRLSENTIYSKDLMDEGIDQGGGSEVVESPLTLWRRNDDFFTDSEAECQQLKIINYRIPQSVPNVKFDVCLTPIVERPPGNTNALLDSNNGTAVNIERTLSDYVSTPFYNVLSKPKGVNLYDLCIIASCKGILQTISKDFIQALQILSSDRECYSHGNLKLYNVFWLYATEVLTLSDMKYNPYPISITKNSAPWASDMVDIALILGKILMKDANFQFKNLNIHSPLDIFEIVNPLSNFPRIPRSKATPNSAHINDSQSYMNSITSRVVAMFNDEYRFQSQENSTISNVDVELGVPPNFNPNNENYSKEDLNKQLESSIYDFIIRLIGKTYDKYSKYDQFTSAEEALSHPFLAQKIDIRMLPSDLS